MILFDPTEAVKTTTIHEELSQIGIPMPGLERATGADIVILRNDTPVTPLDLSNEHSLEIGRLAQSDMQNSEIAKSIGVPLPIVMKINRFRNAVMQRGILVQRKSGMDLFSHSDFALHLFVVLERMLVWTKAPWLLCTARFQAGSDGNAVINGRKTGLSYNAVVGLVDAWQWRGGLFTTLNDDKEICEWLRMKESWLNKPEEPTKILVPNKRPMQILTTEDNNAISTLQTFQGVGAVMARRLAETFDSLALVLCFLSDETAHSWDTKPEGFGPTINQWARNRLGLEKGERLTIVRDNDQYIEGEKK